MSKYIVGLFDDDEVLLRAVTTVRRAGVKIHDVFTPFPVHGLDAAMGLKDSRLHTVGFAVGATGATLALAFIIWTSAISYPLNIGGKPLVALPSYIPITFEITILTASIAMVVSFFIRCGLSAIKKPRIFDERITNDKFAMVFDISEGGNVQEITSLLKGNGAVEVNEKDFEND